MKKLVHSLLLASVIVSPFVLYGMGNENHSKFLFHFSKILQEKKSLKMELVEKIIQNPDLQHLSNLNIHNLSTLNKTDHAEIFVTVISSIESQKNLNTVIRFLINASSIIKN